MDEKELLAVRIEELRNSMASLAQAHDAMLGVLGDALSMKDAETARHSKRVTAFTVAIARAMGLPKEEISVIARGAFLHDIGKMAIRDSILNKPGKLSPEEIAIMREHCASGYNLLKNIPFLRDASEIVWAHHEHYDGSGYPRGLKGNEIPPGARIVAVANTLDAITSDWPYRRKQSLDVASKEIERSTGTQFDPEVVRAFVNIPVTTWESLREASTERAVSEPSVSAGAPSLETQNAPVPVVDPVDLKKVFEVFAEHPNHNIGIDYLAGICDAKADVQAIAERATMLRLLVHLEKEHYAGSFAPWWHGEQLADAVFQVVAKAPLTRWVRHRGFPFNMTPDEFFGQIQQADREKR